MLKYESNAINDRSRINLKSQRNTEPHQSVVLIAAIYIFYCIYILCVGMIAGGQNALNLGFSSLFRILTISILIPYLLIGSRHFASSMDMAFPKPNIVNLERRINSRVHFILFIVLILSYIFTPPPEISSILPSIESGFWANLLFVINWLSTIIILYLMAKVLWIIICVSWGLGQLSQDHSRNAVKIDLYNSDNIGGLGPLRDLILFLTVFQFGGISLAIANFSSSGTFGPIVLFFIPMSLFSVYLFFKGWFVIRNLVEKERTREVDIINSIYNKKMQILLNAEEDVTMHEDIKDISNSIVVISVERERLLNASKVVFDYKSIFAFISSSLLPFVTQFIIPIFKI